MSVKFAASSPLSERPSCYNITASWINRTNKLYNAFLNQKYVKGVYKQKEEEEEVEKGEEGMEERGGREEM